MKRITFIAFIFTSFFVITGCSKSPEEKFLSYADNILDIAHNNASDCDKLEEELNKFIKKNKNADSIASMREELREVWSEKSELYKDEDLELNKFPYKPQAAFNKWLIEDEEAKQIGLKFAIIIVTFSLKKRLGDTDKDKCVKSTSDAMFSIYPYNLE